MPMMSPRAVFSALSDEDWFETLILSVEQPVQRGVTLPSFPKEKLQIRTVGSANETAIKEAFRFYAFVRELCDSLGRPLAANTPILDFGVGWGRIIRCFLRDVDPHNLYGVDTASRWLRIARKTNCKAWLNLIEPKGDLPFKKRSFDLVYAYSTFTHLPADLQDHWLSEIRRVMKRGALFIATVNSPRFFSQIRALNDSAGEDHPWRKRLINYLDRHPALPSRLKRRGSIFIESKHANHGDRVVTEAYVRNHWSQWFTVVKFVDDAVRFGQAIVVLTR